MKDKKPFGTSTAVIFAGGKSSRMGQDKSLIPFGGFATLSEYQLRRLEPLFEQVYLSTKEGKFGFEADLIYDRSHESSPLVGLVSIFETIDVQECFVLSVDAPFVDEGTIARIYLESNDETLDAIIAKSPGGAQPLCGIYRRSIVPFAKSFMAEGNHKLNALLAASKTRFVNFGEEDCFLNLNRPEDYYAALQRVQNSSFRFK